MSICGQSLGLIETVGLAAAVEAADAAIKSANVQLLGCEPAKGNGLHTVKLVGDVGAVTAAVDAGVAAASLIGQVYAYKVLARTAEGLGAVIASGENTGVMEARAPKQRSTIADAPTTEVKEVLIVADEEAKGVSVDNVSTINTQSKIDKKPSATEKKLTKSTTAKKRTTKASSSDTTKT